MAASRSGRSGPAEKAESSEDFWDTYVHNRGPFPQTIGKQAFVKGGRNMIDQTSANDVKVCADRCLDAARCHAFSYDDVSGDCQLAFGDFRTVAAPTSTIFVHKERRTAVVNKPNAGTAGPAKAATQPTPASLHTVNTPKPVEK